MATIQRVAGKHLKELCLWGLSYGSSGTILSDMSGFVCLQTFEVDVGMLLSPPYEDSDEGEENEDGDGDDADIEDSDWLEHFERIGSLPIHNTRLVDLLPASIETVRVFGWSYPTPSEQYAPGIKNLRTLFRDFALERPAKLPALNDISFSRAKPDSYQIPEYVELLTALEGEGLLHYCRCQWMVWSAR
jgi:hypothetical protein